jgi:hypothetical protein
MQKKGRDAGRIDSQSFLPRMNTETGHRFCFCKHEKIETGQAGGAVETFCGEDAALHFFND